ncbi:hypothetical protein [Aneurinibacillus tyrosinisolvens]|uniref:hypothetical protein n=1 Tax=Aneurinibacillus tyrosinisolvens TaxID=1443435 RepID=UPI000B013516|nr:hypothetical protein [Aneurinibacillus tyrosinisolvens]
MYAAEIEEAGNSPAFLDIIEKTSTAYRSLGFNKFLAFFFVIASTSSPLAPIKTTIEYIGMNRL